ncbi:MAG: cellulase family glycosylhydrolase [Kineosporiaceae bacterium]
MSRRTPWKATLTALLLGASALVAAPAVLAPSAQAAPVKIMALGDSITGSPGCWRALLWQKLTQSGYTNIDFVGTQPGQGCGFAYDGENEGHGGELVTNVADQNLMPARLATTNPDVVLMHFATNDVWSARTNDQIFAAWTKIVGQMRENNPRVKVLVAKIIPVAPAACPECPARTVTLNNAIPAWAAGLSTTSSPITVVDQWTGWNPTTDTGDGVHPNDAGIVKMAERWYPAVVSALGGTTPTTSTTVPTGTAKPTTTSTTKPAADGKGFFVKGGRLYESNGSEFVISGINHAHVWYTSQTSSFAAIKAAGANTVRVVLGGGRWGPSSVADVKNVVSLCKTNKLICVLENHDTTGYQEQSGSTSLDAAATYWISIADALKGEEKYVIVNIGNEPWGNTGYTGWTADTQAAIKKLRAAGFTHTLMVDAPNWGQDWAGTMKDNAPAVFAADPLANTVFSIHMYGVYNSADKVKSYLDSFVSRGLPILVGEFGNMHSDGDPDEDTIMAYTRAKGLGMMGWSWSGNGGGVEYLDMTTNFNPAQLTTWGQRFINGTDGLKARGVKEATVYSGVVTTPPTTTTPPVSTTTTKPTTTTPTTTKPTTSCKGKTCTTKKPAKTKTVKKCKTGKNGKKTCKTITRKAAVAALTGEDTAALYGSPVCSVTYRGTGAWDGGFSAQVTVTSSVATLVPVRWTLTYPDGVTVTQVIGERASASGNAASGTGTGSVVVTATGQAATPTATCG